MRHPPLGSNAAELKCRYRLSCLNSTASMYTSQHFLKAWVYVYTSQHGTPSAQPAEASKATLYPAHSCMRREEGARCFVVWCREYPNTQAPSATRILVHLWEAHLSRGASPFHIGLHKSCAPTELPLLVPRVQRLKPDLL